MWCFIDSLSSETKGFFCFAFDKKMLLGKVPFLHTLFLEHEVQPSEKNYRAMFSSGNESQMQKFANLEQKKGTKIVTYPLLWLHVASSIINNFDCSDGRTVTSYYQRLNFVCLITTVFIDTRLWKTKHLRKHFQNFRQSYMLLTDPIKIHQSQPASMM